MRSGEQAALGNDLKEMMDALGIPMRVLAGYDWGGRAACVVAALWPERVRGLVTCGGYNMHDVAGSAKPASAEQEHRYWYQYYFHTERGRAGLTAEPARHREVVVEAVVAERRFDDATFARTAASFDNPDFVDVVIHSYRVRYGYVPGDPALARSSAPRRETADRRAGHQAAGRGDGHRAVRTPRQPCAPLHRAYQRRTIPLVGHNVPQEAPRETARAVIELVRG